MPELSDRTKIAELIRRKLAEDLCGAVDFLGVKMIKLPSVFAPTLNTPFLTEIVKTRVELFTGSSRPSVLEMGCGTGAAITWLSMQHRIEAFATDISLMAHLNTLANAAWHSVEISAYVGNLFEAIPPRQFDLIFWNPPFLPLRQPEEGIRFRASFDHNYDSISQFLLQSPEFLSPTGSLVLCLDNLISDASAILDVAYKAGYIVDVLAHRTSRWYEYDLKYTCYELTLRPGGIR